MNEYEKLYAAYLELDEKYKSALKQISIFRDNNTRLIVKLIELEKPMNTKIAIKKHLNDVD